MDTLVKRPERSENRALVSHAALPSVSLQGALLIAEREEGTKSWLVLDGMTLGGSTSVTVCV